MLGVCLDQLFHGENSKCLGNASLVTEPVRRKRADAISCVGRPFLHTTTAKNYKRKNGKKEEAPKSGEEEEEKKALIGMSTEMTRKQVWIMGSRPVERVFDHIIVRGGQIFWVAFLQSLTLGKGNSSLKNEMLLAWPKWDILRWTRFQADMCPRRLSSN